MDFSWYPTLLHKKIKQMSDDGFLAPSDPNIQNLDYWILCPYVCQFPYILSPVFQKCQPPYSKNRGTFHGICGPVFQISFAVGTRIPWTRDLPNQIIYSWHLNGFYSSPNFNSNPLHFCLWPCSKRRCRRTLKRNPTKIQHNSRQDFINHGSNRWPLQRFLPIFLRWLVEKC